MCSSAQNNIMRHDRNWTARRRSLRRSERLNGYKSYKVTNDPAHLPL
jgi:hypothetical protein